MSIQAKTLVILSVTTAERLLLTHIFNGSHDEGNSWNWNIILKISTQISLPFNCTWFEKRQFWSSFKSDTTRENPVKCRLISVTFSKRMKLVNDKVKTKAQGHSGGRQCWRCAVDIEHISQGPAMLFTWFTGLAAHHGLWCSVRKREKDCNFGPIV